MSNHLWDGYVPPVGRLEVLPADVAGAARDVPVLYLDRGEPSAYRFVTQAYTDEAYEHGLKHGPSVQDSYTNPWSLGSNPCERLGANLGECADAIRDSRPTEEMLTAYADLRSRLDAKLAATDFAVVSARRKRRRRDTGDFVNIDAVMTGDPNCWERHEREASQRLVKIFINACYSAGTSTKQIMQGGVKAAALSDLLVSKGYRVEILAACFSNGGHSGPQIKPYGVVATVKRSNDPLDVGAILCAGSPAHTRVHMFGAAQSIPGGHGFGGEGVCSVSQHPKLAAALGVDFWISGHDAYWSNTAKQGSRLASLAETINGL